MTTPMMRKTLLASSLFLFPGFANALGLGTIDVKSALNEPLNAEIELVFASPAEQESLSVRLAGAEDFQRVGLDASRLTVPLQFNVDRGSKGQSVIRVTSDRPVKDPALTILLEVNWGAGRLLREYSILLDPPLMAPAIRGSAAVATAVVDPAPAAVVEAPKPAPSAPANPAVAATPPAPRQEAPKPAPAPKPEAAQPTPPPAAKSEAAKAAPVKTTPATPPPAPSGVTPAQPAASTYGPVDPGKNLLQVAREVAPGSAEEMNRFMVAVLRTNPQSFYQDNVNALKRGAVLTLPTQAQLASINPADAAEVVRTHNDLWRQYAQSAAAQPTRLADTGSAGTGRPTAAEAGSPNSRLELAPPKAGEGQGAADAPSSNARNAGNAEEVSKLRRDLQLRQEELSSSQRELDEMRSRVKDLEGLKNKQDSLIKLKDDEIAQLQARLAEVGKEVEAAQSAASKAETALQAAAPTPAPAPEVAAAPAVTEPVATTPELPEPVAAAPAVSEPTPEPMTEPSPTGEGDDIWGSTDPAPADGETAVTAAPDPAPAEPEPVPTPTPTPPPMDESATSPAPAASGGLFSLPVIGGVLALLAAGIGAFVWQRGRRNKPDRKANLPPIMSGDLDSSPAADQEDDLRDRIAMNPGDLGAHLELLRYLHGENRAETYDAATEAMYRYVSDPECNEWREALMLGADLMPQHPRYVAMNDAHGDKDAPVQNELSELDLGSLSTAHAPAAPTAPAIPEFKFDFDSPAPVSPLPVKLDLPAPAAPAPAPAPDFDFNFDNLLGPAPSPAVAPAKPVKPAPPSFDFDLGATPPAPAPAPAALDFAFDLDSEGPTRRIEPVPAASAPASESDFSFDFDSLLSPAAPVVPAPAPARPATAEQRTNTMALPELDSLMNSLAPSPAPAQIPIPALAPSPAPAKKDLSLDFGDLDLNFDNLKSPVADFKPIELETQMPPQPASVLEQPDIIPLDVDFSLDDPSFLGGDDAIATKLDLARAYIDMSDPDGARAMLEEVLTEGTSAQKSEAREILAQIG